MFGLKRGTISLSLHNPEWKNLFLEEKGRLLASIGSHILSIEHIGSTSIPGLSAKPIIDMGISIKRFEDGFACVSALEALGYLYKGENGIEHRHYFRTDADIVKFHIHMFPKDHPKLKDHLLFRDYLITHPEEKDRYQQLKKQLSQKYASQRELYTASKSSFIEGILEKAREQISPS